MSKKSSSSVLQKKLQDLESELTIAFSLPPHQASSTNYELDCSQYFVNRFDFLRKLISAEIASLSSTSSPKKPFYLQKVVRRFTELETKFQEWESTCTWKPLTALDDHQSEPAASTCSCTESRVHDDEKYYERLAEEEVHAHNMYEWLNGDEEEAGTAEMGSPGFEEAKKVFEEVKEDEKVENTSMEEACGRSESEKRSLWVRKHVGAMVAGLVLGMACMGSLVVTFSGCFHYVNHHNIHLPPT